MTKRSSTSVIFFIMGGFFTVFIATLAIVPFLNELLLVEVSNKEVPFAIITPTISYFPEEQVVTVLYQMEENEKEISAIYIEIFQPSKETIYYMEIPVETKITLSNELYKSLQTYSPELPQYFKLSKMAEGFSKDYALTGCNRILSELLGVTFVHYVGGEKEVLQHWMECIAKQNTKKEFFDAYVVWLENSMSDLSTKERWMYYESYQKINSVVQQMALGSQELGGYSISSKQCKELLEHWQYLLREEQKGF